jgi:pantetheine-phosphate adenylyltransferase
VSFAVYPGSFDPVTYGHVDIVIRAAGIFPSLVVAVFDSPAKSLLFSTQERVDLFQRSIEGIPNVEVRPYYGLTVNFAREIGATVLVRGLRMATDFDFEFEMALMNRKLAPDIEIVSFMSSLEYQYLSSTLLKDIVRLGGDIREFVPNYVASALKHRMKDLAKDPK